MSELRWNPLLGTWTMVAANRQNRPNMPKDWCPFCPGEGKKVPESFQTYIYPNDFPALSGLQGDDIQDIATDAIYHTQPAKGACEVILYSPDHTAHLYDLSDEHMDELVDLWADRITHYRQFPLVKYVYEFENRGAEVGVTMPHPHGQLYAFPFVPLKLVSELSNAKDFYRRTGKNLLAEMVSVEQTDGRRVIFESSHFLIFLPHFTDYPYGIFVVAKDDYLFIDQMPSDVRHDLGQCLQKCTGMLDELFNRPFPYMMCFHQGTIHAPEWNNQEHFFRFHIEFYPPLRTADTIKYYASTEMGAWAAANTRAVEETALELKEALDRYLQKNK